MTIEKQSLSSEKNIFTSHKFRSVVDDAINFIVHTACYKFPPDEKFIGGGVYILYYCGDYELYSKISNDNPSACTTPVYVGKAVCSGWRTGRINITNEPKLFQRLREHARNIDIAENLDRKDFRCRYILLKGRESDLIGSVEAELIRRSTPLWNTVVDGFGNHDPGKGRYNQAKSEWDVLHPGRKWALKCKGKAPSRSETMRKVKGYISSSL